MKPVVNLYKLGRLPYVKALNVQQVLFDKLKNAVTSGYNLASPVTKSENLVHNTSGGYENLVVGNSLILVEHEPVYTIGIRSKQYNDEYVSRIKEKLNEHKLKADFVKTSRGGLITFHGPGQLVAYPIIYLGDFKTTIRDRSVKAYVKLLENTIIDTLANVGVEGAHTVKEYPGVWLGNGERKIAFIGITCKRFVTMHGVSINCDCDLSWFDHIVSCGIEDKSITSVSQELLVKNQKWPTKIAENEPEISSTEHGHNLFNTKPSSSSTTLNVSESDIDSISKAFCVSFSQHFDCNIMEDLKLKRTLPTIASKINTLSL